MIFKLSFSLLVPVVSECSNRGNGYGAFLLLILGAGICAVHLATHHTPRTSGAGGGPAGLGGACVARLQLSALHGVRELSSGRAGKAGAGGVAAAAAAEGAFTGFG